MTCVNKNWGFFVLALVSCVLSGCSPDKTRVGVYSLAVLECDSQPTPKKRAECKRSQREGGRFQSAYAKNLLEKTGSKSAQILEQRIRAQELYMQGQALSREGKNREALVLYLDAIQKFSGHADAYYEIATIFIAEKEPERALSYLKMATQLNPHWPRALFLQGMLCDIMHDSACALNSYMKAIEEDPSQPEYYYNTAFIYDQFELKDKAAEFFAKAVSIWNNSLILNPDYFVGKPDLLAPFEGAKKYIAQQENGTERIPGAF